MWDYDSGECEKILRGHTNAVQCVDFDSGGNTLGMSPRLIFFIVFLVLRCCVLNSIMLGGFEYKIMEHADLSVCQDVKGE